MLTMWLEEISRIGQFFWLVHFVLNYDPENPIPILFIGCKIYCFSAKAVMPAKEKNIYKTIANDILI